jgi:arylsulfatase A-like enzyme
MVVALGDAWALRRAWGSVGERAAIALAVAAIVAGAALALAPWIEALVGERRVRAWAAAAIAGAIVGVPLAATATAVRAIGFVAAAIVLPIAIAAAIVATARAPRMIAATIGAGELVTLWALPRRLYPSLRATLLVCAFAALACALRRAGASGQTRTRNGLVATAIGCMLVIGGAALARLDANTRFVTHAQAPSASLVLEVVERIAPPRPPARAANALSSSPSSPSASRSSANAAWPAELAHDGSLANAHLVLVTVDALRADRLARMPALAALAARGVTFTHAYAAAPSTATSITSLMTARAPGRLDDRPPTLAEQLRAAGWNTEDFYPAGLFFDGGTTLAPYAAAHFGVAWADTRTQPADALTDAALARMRRAAARGEPRSFFWLHYFDPHEPYEPHELARDAPPIARYDAEVRAVDRALGRLVEGLAIFARPTLLVVTADHGEEFGEHGGAYHGTSLYDEQLRVPLVIALVGGALAPARIDAPVSLVGLLPAVAALLDAPVLPAPHNGGDVFAAVDTSRMILRGSWKLVRDTRRDVDELYDLAADPAELHNLAAARADVAAPLAAALQAWLGAPTVAALAATVADRAQSAATRAAAARELGAREAYAGGAALRAVLGDADAGVVVRAEAALALAELTDNRARAPLELLLADERFADRAAVMLGRLRDRAAAARLAAICRRPPATGDHELAAQRRDAAHYLGFVGDAAAVDALFAAAADPRVRGSAWLAVGRIAARTHDAAVARRLEAQLAVEDRADAHDDLLAALALARN